MALGGVAAGMLVAALAGLVTRFTTLKEDASLAAIYLVALALGVTLISGHGTQLDLLHILFGSALGVDTPGLLDGRRRGQRQRAAAGRDVPGAGAGEF